MIRASLLQGLPALDGLDHDHVERLAAHMSLVKAAEGQILIHEGRRSPGAFVALDGPLLVEKSLSSGPSQGLLPAGEWFGMVSLLDGLPASATVRARSAVNVAAIGRADFWALIRPGEPFGARLLRAVLESLALQLQRVDAAVVEARGTLELV